VKNDSLNYHLTPLCIIKYCDYYFFTMNQFYLQILKSMTDGNDVNYVKMIMNLWMLQLGGNSETVASYFRSMKYGGMFGGYQFLDERGNSLLSWAAYYGRRDLILLFATEYGFTVNRQNMDGDTALHFAIKGAYYDCMTTLIHVGADVNIGNLNGETPLHMAICSGLHFVQFLIERGSEIESEDDYGDTPLHWAVREDEMDILVYLLDKGADVNHANEDDETPSMYAEIFGTENLKRLINFHVQSRLSGSFHYDPGPGCDTMEPMDVDHDVPTYSFSADEMHTFPQKNVVSVKFYNEYH